MPGHVHAASFPRRAILCLSAAAAAGGLPIYAAVINGSPLYGMMPYGFALAACVATPVAVFYAFRKRRTVRD